jgi:hypothetical protein
VCALAICCVVASRQPDAALALERWNIAQDACDRERRVRRRAYERARDRALIAVAMSGGVQADQTVASNDADRLSARGRGERRSGRARRHIKDRRTAASRR